MLRAIDMSTSLVLFSGGMDSTIALFDRLLVARKEGGQVHTLTFSYGQRHASEVGHARLIMSRIATSELYAPIMGRFITHRIHMPPFGSLLGGEPVMKYDNVAQAEQAVHDTSFVPYRNMIFLTVAAQFAYHLGVNVISTGLRGGFPDCTGEWEEHMARMLRESVPSHPILLRTITHRSREECLKIAKEMPGCIEALGISLTCFEGTTPPCGHCLPCLKRAEGFAAIGMQDPLETPRYGPR